MVHDIDGSNGTRFINILHHVEVFPIDERIPNVSLAVRHGTAPTLAGSFALAGTQTLRVFLPGDDKAGVFNRAHFDTEGIAPPGSEPLGIGPNHMRLFHDIGCSGIITGQ